MAPTKSTHKQSDTASEGSPPQNGVALKSRRVLTETRSQGQSKKRKRIPKPPTQDVPVADTDDESVLVDGPVVDGFEALEAQVRAEAEARTPVGKPSQSRAATRTRRRSGSISEYDSQDNRIVDVAAVENDSPQCGRGDPNLSGISPPLPATLVEPEAQGFETGFHVVTGGTEVGISLFRGIAESLLDCRNPSMASFPTWEKAHGYYSVCFAANSVHIRQPRHEETPIHSPIRKKTKVRETRAVTRARALIQPHFAPAMNPRGSPPINSECDHGASVAAHDPVADLARSINLSYHRVRLDAIAQSVNNGSSHGAQASARQPQPQDPATSRPISRPFVVVVDSSDDEIPTANSMRDSRNPNNSDHGASVAAHDPVADLARSINLSYHRVRLGAIAQSVNNGSSHGVQASARQPQPQDPATSSPISRPFVVVVDSSDDEMPTANSVCDGRNPNNRNVPALPVPSSSLVVEINSDPPTIYHAESPTIIVYDSEEEELIYPESDMERELN